jgi:hypothetical protein
MLSSDPTRLGKRHGARIWFHLLLVGADSGNLVVRGSRGVSAQLGGDSPGDAFFVERLGFVLTTFLLLSFLLGWIERANWTRSLGVATAAALGSFAIFELWLKIRLPKGIFGF